MEKTFEEYREVFREFYGSVAKGHRESKRPHRGHGLDHDVTVAMIAVQIAPDEQTIRKSWCAGMLHSTDRIVEKNDVERIMRGHIACLPAGMFSPEETEEIFQSAFRHGELNQNDQSVIQQILMDADRLANLMPAVIIRAGQFQPTIPAFEFEFLNDNGNPASTYYEPRSVLDDLRNNIAEYIPKLRIPAAKKLSAVYVIQLKEFISNLEKSYRKLGLAGISL